MDAINDFYSSEPLEALTRAFFGYDANNVIIDKWGNERREPFNPNREYFYFNAYGNLVSADEKDYSTYLDDWVIEELYEHRDEIDEIPEYVDKLFSAWEDNDEEDFDEDDEDDDEL